MQNKETILVDKGALQEMLDAQYERIVSSLTKPEPDELWTRKDLAEHYKVSARTISRWIERGELPTSTNNRWSKQEILRLDKQA